MSELEEQRKRRMEMAQELEDAIDEAIEEDLNTLSFTVDSNGYLDLDVNIEK